jgi:hypothetical protein
MNHGILVGADFLLSTLGTKVLTSKTAKKGYVKAMVCGMQAKDELATLVDEAKAEFDDLMAEAGYEKEVEDVEEDVAEVVETKE